MKHFDWLRSFSHCFRIDAKIILVRKSLKITICIRVTRTAETSDDKNVRRSHDPSGRVHLMIQAFLWVSQTRAPRTKMALPCPRPGKWDFNFHLDCPHPTFDQTVAGLGHRLVSKLIFVSGELLNASHNRRILRMIFSRLKK